MLECEGNGLRASEPEEKHLIKELIAFIRRAPGLVSKERRFQERLVETRFGMWGGQAMEFSEGQEG